MMKVISLLIVFVAVKVACGTDPAKCQRFIKYMLINSCGATKRHTNLSPFHQYSIMDTEEIEQQYRDMVEKGVIKGVDFTETGYPNSNIPLMNNKNVAADKLENEDDPLLYSRWKRDVFSPIIRVRDKYIAEPRNVDRIGSLYFVGDLPSGEEYKSPLPGALKAKCCGEYLCSVDDFKGFCV